MSEKNYDVVITGGRVIDPETGLDEIRNVGINGDKIAIVTKDEIKGKETINAKGHVVAPGFIDMHSHNSSVPFGEKVALRDGTTTPMELEGGGFPVADWYANAKGKCRANYGLSAGTAGVRETILNDNYKSANSGQFLLDMLGNPKDSNFTMQWSTQVATADQIKKFEKMLEEGVQDGSVGVGHGPGYMVNGCTNEESVIAQKVAAKYGQSTYNHCRFSSQMPPTSGLLGFLEMMAPQEVYGGGVVIQHLTAQALSQSMTALEMIDNARDKGIQILAEIYPYDFGASIVAADYLHPDNYQKNMGRDYPDIIETSTVKPLTKERYEELVKTAPGTSIMFYNAQEEDVIKALAHPTTVIGCDAFPYTVRATGEVAKDWDTPFDAVNGHPRGAGTHARLLKWVREKKVDIPLSLAVSKMTYMIADYMEQNGVPQMSNKGRIQVGKDADITIFDPETVQDNATMKDGGLPSTGIPYVLVNGTIVVKNSEMVNDVFPGKPVHGTGKKI